MSLHCARQTDAERLHRILHWRMRDELLNGTLFLELDQGRRRLQNAGSQAAYQQPRLQLPLDEASVAGQKLVTFANIAALKHDGNGIYALVLSNLALVHAGDA